MSDVGDRMGSNHRVSFLLSLSVTKRGSASGFSLRVVSEKEGGENDLSNCLVLHHLPCT